MTAAQARRIAKAWIEHNTDDDSGRSERMKAEIMDVEWVIENEIAMGLSQRQIAQTYALALRSSYPTDWKRVNAAILKRWPKGLLRIKKMAWSGKCFAEPANAKGAK